MNVQINDVTDIIIEVVKSATLGTTWRSIKVKGKGGTHQITLFADRDDAENLEITLGEQ
tara:strand:- start:1344 stop:1520 length:177 start_codon:yes stop_codon:yes gene_type:complete